MPSGCTACCRYLKDLPKKVEGRACQREMLLRALCWEKHLLQVAQYATSHQCKLHMVPWLAGKWVELRNSCVKNGLHSEGSISDVWYPQAVGICLLKLMELCSEPSPRSHSVKEYDWGLLEVNTFNSVGVIQNMVADILVSFFKQGYN